MYDVILTISDIHFPYEHPDLIKFLSAIKKKYVLKAKKPLIVVGGDEGDGHSWSFHDHDPDLVSPSDELQTVINRMKWLYKLFPKAIVLESNHGSLFYRRLKSHGLPRHIIKPYNQLLEAPKTWHWVKDLQIRMSNDRLVYFTHGKVTDVTKLSQSMGMSAVQFHFHEKFKIEYWANPLDLFWGMQCGCLIDDEALAFAYNKSNLKRPLVGTGIIINGHPRLLPMILNKNGRWTGELL